MQRELFKISFSSLWLMVGKGEKGLDNQNTSEWQNEDLLQSADCSIAKHVLDKAEMGKSNALCTYLP